MTGYAAVAVAEPFFKKGDVIVYTKGRKPNDREDYKAESDEDPLDVPTAVSATEPWPSATFEPVDPAFTLAPLPITVELATPLSVARLPTTEEAAPVAELVQAFGASGRVALCPRLDDDPVAVAAEALHCGVVDDILGFEEQMRRLERGAGRKRDGEAHTVALALPLSRPVERLRQSGPPRVELRARRGRDLAD